MPSFIAYPRWFNDYSSLIDSRFLDYLPGLIVGQISVSRSAAMNDVCATTSSGSPVHTAQGQQFTLESVKATFHCVHIHINLKASPKLGPARQRCRAYRYIQCLNNCSLGLKTFQKTQRVSRELQNEKGFSPRCEIFRYSRYTNFVF